MNVDVTKAYDHVLHTRLRHNLEKKIGQTEELNESKVF